MGSRKKLVLASLVSLMMATAFVIGLMPLHGTLRASAASSGSGRPDMVDLVNAVLNFQGSEPATDIVVTEPPDGIEYVVPDGAAQVIVNYQASAMGNASPVAYWTDSDASLDFGLVFAETAPYYNASLDVAGLLGPTTTALSVYALANASFDGVDLATFVYEVASDAVDFTVTKVVQDDTDPDQNGLPAPLTSVLGPGTNWRTSYVLFLYDEDGNAVGWGSRDVAIASLNAPLAKQAFDLGVTVSPQPGVFVASPTFDQLLNAGLVYADELGYLIVTSAIPLQLTIDQLYGGDTDPGSIAAWAAGVEAIAPPGGRVGQDIGGDEPAAAPYVEIALLAVDTAADTYREIETLPADLPVELELQDLVLDPDVSVQLWSYPSWLVDVEAGLEDFAFESLEAGAELYGIEGAWQFIGQRRDDTVGQAADSFIAEITSLSIFGAFNAVMEIYSVYPDSASTCTDSAGNVDIVGTFGVGGDVSAVDLEAQFDVFFGDQLATIVSASAVYGDFVSFTVDAPGSVVPQMVGVSVVDTTVAASLALLEDAFTYYDIFTLTLTDPEGGTVEAAPVQDTYLAGDTVNLTATADALYEFVAWTGDVDDVLDINDPTTTLTFDRDEGETCADLDLVISAQFQYTILPTEYFLTTNVQPEGAGVIQQNPAGTGPFAPDTIIDLNAIPDAGYAFVGWLGPVADANSAVTTVTMTGPDPTIEVTALFEPTFYTLTVIEDPDEGGDVTVEPVQATYDPSDVVTLTADANPGWVFSAWVIDEDVIELGNPLELAFAGRPRRDVVVRAVFTQNPILTILEPIGGEVQFSPSEPCDDDLTEQCLISQQTVDGDLLLEYFAGTDVTLTAVPDGGFRFVHWEIDGEVFTDNPVSFELLTSTTVRAVFTTTVFFVTEITPDQAWFFGGVKARITGGGFIPDVTQLRVFGNPVDPIAVTSSEIWFIVPPLPVPPANQSLEVEVTVSNPPFDVLESRTIDDFLYRRYETVGNVTTTAFQFDAGDGTLDIPVALGASLADASLVLPEPEQAIDFAYGLIRATEQPELIEADAIFAGTGSVPVADVWNFAIHLYDPDIAVGELNTEGLGSAVYDEITEWTYPRDEDADAAELTFTVVDTPLVAADIREVISMWSIDTLYEFGLDETTLVGSVSGYQSTLTQTEVLPIVSPEAPVGTTPITSVTTRLYDLTAFALRDGTIELPAEILAGAAIVDPDGTVEGDTDGGTPFTINAPNGGLAWVTVGFADEITDTTPASATRLATVVNNGATEFSVLVESPAWTPNEDILVDVAVYLNSDLTQPVVIFDNGFQYRAVGKPDNRLLLLLLGLLAALIGLAAGGDSGGGGGPCFIATAAYGTPMAADIDTLRALRDTYLLESSIGTACVDAYYSVSPAIASVVAKSPALAAVVRVLLVPVVFAAKCLLAMPWVSMLTLAVCLALARIRRRAKSKA